MYIFLYIQKSQTHLFSLRLHPPKSTEQINLTNSANAGYRSDLGRTEGHLFNFFLFLFCLVLFFRYSYTDMLTSNNYTERFCFYNYYNDLKNRF